MAIGDKIPVGRAKDITQKIFGPFTVLYRCEYKNDRPYWKVKCNNCGTEDIRRGNELTNPAKKLVCKECGKIDNKTGKKFGLLTVLKEWKRQNGRIYWKCICDCGKETWVSSGNLTSGQVKSCGCLSGRNQKIKKEKREIDWAKLKPGDEIPLGKAKDLTGQKFKKLTVLYRCIPPDSYSKNERSAFWMCKCDCGKYVIVNSYQLQYGKTHSCGCYNKELNKIKLKKIHEKYAKECIEKNKNKKFGMLKTLYPLENNKDRYIVWHCICDCGREIDVKSSDLTSGRKYCCGCISGSSGEQKVHHILYIKQIIFKREHSVRINNDLFKFDFYLPDYNCYIEYDGEQHFKESSMCSNTLQERQRRDNIKNQYCKDNNIYLIRIPYTDYNILDEEYIMERLNNLKKYNYNKQK